MPPDIIKATQAGDLVLLLTHVGGNIWVVETHDWSGKVAVGDSTNQYRRQYGGVSFSGEADALADFERQFAVISATAALTNKPLKIKELI